MGLLTAECLPEETAIDRLTPWSGADLDDLTAGQVREEAPSDAGDPSGVLGQPEDGPPWQRPAKHWIDVRLVLLRMLFTHEA